MNLVPLLNNLEDRKQFFINNAIPGDLVLVKIFDTVGDIFIIGFFDEIELWGSNQIGVYTDHRWERRLRLAYNIERIILVKEVFPHLVHIFQTIFEEKLVEKEKKQNNRTGILVQKKNY